MAAFGLMKQNGFIPICAHEAVRCTRMVCILRLRVMLGKVGCTTAGTTSAWVQKRGRLRQGGLSDAISFLYVFGSYVVLWWLTLLVVVSLVGRT
ncbi:hypothetical protein BKA66DRAFT_469636 [Pyrenochaeta sp. MPI-SDFR-AT-0127]|nr:hypothetical protein BKA66DRAFT_469636 [Pyrenochaeta sp. MPI-SDFR-AT-0127]